MRSLAPIMGALLLALGSGCGDEAASGGKGRPDVIDDRIILEGGSGSDAVAADVSSAIDAAVEDLGLTGEDATVADAGEDASTEPDATVPDAAPDPCPVRAIGMESF